MHSVEKKKDLRISNLSVHFRKLEKEEQFWPKANRRKEKLGQKSMKLEIGKQWRLEDDIVKRRKKDKPQTKRKYLSNTCLIRDLYLKCMRKFKTPK